LKKTSLLSLQDGSIEIPGVLQLYMGGKSVMEPSTNKLKHKSIYYQHGLIKNYYGEA
jgi:hypothetical protein